MIVETLILQTEQQVGKLHKTDQLKHMKVPCRAHKRREPSIEINLQILVQLFIHKTIDV